MSNKNQLLNIILLLSASYFLIGGIVHFFGLTLFPWYYAPLYSPYHDTVIALASFVLSIILFTVGRNPQKNIDVLNALIFATFLAVIFSFYILFKINFTPETEMKRIQTIIELFLLVIFMVALILLRPTGKK